MNICYLLESTILGGGVRIIFDQAFYLKQRGHNVWIRSRRGAHDWYPYPVDVEYVENLDAPFDEFHFPDVIICTYWTTVSFGIKHNSPVIVHLCQGYEGDFPELRKYKKSIEDSYNVPIPKIVIGDWIAKRLLTIFGHSFSVFNVGQIIDTRLFKPSFSIRKYLSFQKIKFRILIVGDYFISCKGIDDALKAIAIYRRSGESVYLIRVSLYPLSTDEIAITRVDESYTMIPPVKMVSIYKRSDLLIAPSHSAEGFGLPFAEALATGLPAIATKIPSYMSFDINHDYALFVNENDPEGIAEAIKSLVSDKYLYKRLMKHGPQLIHKRFKGENVASNMENIFCSLLQSKK